MNESVEVAPRVLAVVVTHNGTEWLETCLESLAAQILPSLDVLVVDCGSTPSPAALVGRVLPSAELVRIEENIGFGAAVNKALELSDKAALAEYYLFMHDDVAPEPEAASLLVASALMTEAGVVGGKAVDWDRGEVIVEVGMSADQFGYPYSGLEAGEIDQGQHDTRRETLYVTNAFMLVSRALVERCGLWDGTYFAFAEDLDLCTRARLSGFKVHVQPGARYRHALALVTGLRPGGIKEPIRFYTRRNRLRTIVKNSAAYRVPFLIVFYLLLATTEVVVLAALRRFEEIPVYPKAFGSFFKTLPAVLKKRRAVQKRRAVPDRRLRRLMVSDVHRARVFLERRISDLEKGTLALGMRTFSRLSPARLKETAGKWAARPLTWAYVALGLVVMVAARQILTGEPVAAGGLWPIPENTRELLTEYLSAWHDRGLGTNAPASPGLLFYWVVSVFTGGRAVATERLLVLVLVALGLIGIVRFVARRTTSPVARFLSGITYGLGPVAELMVSTADLGAMAMFAGFPYLLEIGTRMLGSVPADQGDLPPTAPTTDALARDLARLSLISAAVIAIAPSALVVIAFFWVIASVHAMTLAWDRSETMRRVKWVLASVPVALIVLIPWSFDALRPTGAALAPLFSRDPGIFTPLWDRPLTDYFLLSPGASFISWIIPLGILVGSLTIPGSSRRREARFFASTWMVFALVGAAVTKGFIPIPAASPAIWLICPLAAMAAMSGHFFAGAREQLPRHAFGAKHVIAPGLSLLLLGGLLAGWGQALFSWERPKDTFAANTGELARSISSYLVSTADQVGDFRVLWLGERWIDPIRSGSRRIDGTPYILTSPAGLTMLDMHDPPPSDGERALEESIDAMVGRRLHLAGHLLAPASIRFIVVDPEDEALMAALRRQSDFALEQQQGGIAVFRNLQWLPRAVLAPVNLVKPLTAQDSQSRGLMMVEWSGGRPIPKRSATVFEGDLPRTRHSQILLGQNYSSAWKARVGGQTLAHSKAFGWSNRFELPSNARGEVRINYTRRWLRFVWLVVQVALLITVALIARGSRRELKGRLL
ncbi:MAG TPA: glycosyltransferase family 2 protein [Actinomycetota bacterium]|nr:glycosyltransferase family 2 protein [Actinomycetota bacterium]